MWSFNIRKMRRRQVKGFRPGNLLAPASLHARSTESRRCCAGDHQSWSLNLFEEILRDSCHGEPHNIPDILTGFVPEKTERIEGT